VSVPGMLRAFQHLGLENDDLCTYCIGGDHPFAGCGPLAKEEVKDQLDLLSISSEGEPIKAD
jgi:hypothetical protein